MFTTGLSSVTWTTRWCVVLDREMVLRRARGYAPLPVPVPMPALFGVHPLGCLRATDTLKGGTPNRSVPTHECPAATEQPATLPWAHLKNTVALAVGRQVPISQHIGDLETRQAYGAFCRTAADLQKLYDARPGLVVCDLHPEYLSTRYATESGGPALAIEHHYAHVAACMAENRDPGPRARRSWDGPGFGPDSTDLGRRIPAHG